MPVDGEDLFDVPMRLTVTDNPPTQAAINIAVYVIEQEDCTTSPSAKRAKSQARRLHAYQYQEADTRVLADGTYDFEFNIDPGHYCLIAEYIDANGDEITSSGNALSVEGKLTPTNSSAVSPVCSALPVSLCLRGSARRCARKILEGENETTESKVSPKPARPALLPAPVAPARGSYSPPGAPPAQQPTVRSAWCSTRRSACRRTCRLHRPPNQPLPLGVKERLSPLKTATSSRSSLMAPTTKPSTFRTPKAPTCLMKDEVNGGVRF